MKLFNVKPQPGDVVTRSVEELKVQNIKLQQITYRLRQRSESLFRSCVSAIKSEDGKRATVYASELVEVRKLLGLLNKVQLALERVITRLETIRELSDITMDLRPVLSSLQEIASQLSDALPEISSQLREVDKCISETLILTKVNDGMEQLVQTGAETQGSDEILKEVRSYVEQRLAEKLPMPPAIAEARMEAVELPSSEGPSSGYSMKEASFEAEPKAYVEDVIFEYLRRRGGRISLKECALELNLPLDDVKDALRSLDRKGKITLRHPS